LGCGNGVFTFTKFGGKCNIDFDVYSALGTTSGFFKGKDIYNQSKKINPKITKKPTLQVDYGLDWKKNLLENAKSLKIYKNLIQHNLENLLPFGDNSFSTIFSNIFYWVDNLEQLFTECYRTLKTNGRLVIFVPDKKFQKNLIYFEFLKHGHQWAKIMDRGTYSNTKHCYSYSEWKSIFSPLGFSEEIHSMYLSERFIRFSQIAMRPFSPYIIEMANKLSMKDRKNIKKRLIKEFLPIILSYLNYEKSLKGGTFHFFVLKKK